MSTGLVICSKCSREVHQEMAAAPGQAMPWRHCESGHLLCEGAEVIYAKPAEVLGAWCGRDLDLADTDPAPRRRPRKGGA